MLLRALSKSPLNSDRHVTSKTSRKLIPVFDQPRNKGNSCNVHSELSVTQLWDITTSSVISYQTEEAVSSSISDIQYHFSSPPTVCSRIIIVSFCSSCPSSSPFYGMYQCKPISILKWLKIAQFIYIQ